VLYTYGIIFCINREGSVIVWGLCPRVGDQFLLGAVGAAQNSWLDFLSLVTVAINQS